MKNKIIYRGVAVAAALFAGALAGAPRAAFSETLGEALSAAYLNNPTLRAERARLRATDEGVAQALSGWRPTVSADASFSRTEIQSSSFNVIRDVTLSPENRAISLDQPVFRGGRTVNSTKEAKSRVRSGREDLRAVEQQTLLDAVTAFMSVARDIEVLELTQANVRFLQMDLDATSDRFEVGELTRTDVAQARARLSGAVTGRIQAEATLSTSRALYNRVIGNMPGTLVVPQTIPDPPASEDAALEIAIANSPLLRAALHEQEAARYAIRVAKGSLLPTVTFSADYSRSIDSFNIGTETTSKSVTARVVVPIYQAGRVHSQVREARQINSQRILEVAEARRLAVEGVNVAWEILRAARATIESSTAQVNANEIALDGVRQEYDVGSRTTLDVLDAEQELLDARVELVTAERDRTVAAYQLMEAMGVLSVSNLGLGIAEYDPEENYDSVKGKWIGWGLRDVE